MRRAVRGAGFAVLAIFILFAPSYAAFEQGEPYYWPRWMMSGGTGLDVFEVSFAEEVDGRRVAFDAFEAVGGHQTGRARLRERTVKRVDDAWRLARQVCRARGGPIYMRLRDASRSGWRVLEDGARDVCLDPRPSDRERRRR